MNVEVKNAKRRKYSKISRTLLSLGVTLSLSQEEVTLVYKFIVPHSVFCLRNIVEATIHHTYMDEETRNSFWLFTVKIPM